MRVITVKNLTASDKDWGTGKVFSAYEEITLTEANLPNYRDRESFLTAIFNDEAQIGDGDAYFSNKNKQVDWLKGNLNCITDTPPFAKPTYRTKNNAISNIASVPINSSLNIDLLISEERYVSGGTMIVENATLGDYITAEVVDKDGAIPEAYRADLCENYPTVNIYVEKMWIDPQNPTILDTRPLNAKITAGLYLRITYYAINEGSTRKVAINYDMQKALV